MALARFRPALRAAATLPAFVLCACMGDAAEGLAPARAADITVKMDFEHRPLPEIPLPNDIATTWDEHSATHRRINASMLAPTELESDIRERIDALDGWGTLQPITIPFSGPIDPMSVRNAHDDVDYATEDDAIFLIDVDPDSPERGQLRHLDLGQGNYPAVLERADYGPNDPRASTLTLLFEEVDEDLDGDGVLDPGEDANRNRALDEGEDRDGDGVLDPPEDTDADGVLDRPNYYPGEDPPADDLAARADALMTFYEVQTHTLIARPMLPLRERTTYAVVVTRRVLDTAGHPVGSPYEWINHIAQNEPLSSLPELLPGGLGLSDVAFTWSFTTGTNSSDWVALRDGLYGHGVQSALGEQFPPVIDEFYPLRDPERVPGPGAPWILYQEQWQQALQLIASGALGLETGSIEFDMTMRAQRFVDFHVMGQYLSPQLFSRYDERGEFLPFNSQSWPEDLDSVPAPARGEAVPFWITVPRRETSSRGEGQPAPIVILGHGYGSNRLEALAFAGFLAEHGVATLAIDNVSHGLSISDEEREQVEVAVSLFGLGPFLDAVLRGRAYDFDRDGDARSGSDFWTSYLFHTRDVLRQTVLDYMQAVRILRTFDGTTRWEFDLNGDGENDLAGDFDGDGAVDISPSSGLHGLGGSLGGMTMTLLGSLEPAMTTIVPISGGGGLADLGIRSQQGGVREAFILWAMGPMLVLDPASGGGRLSLAVANLNRFDSYPVADIAGVQPGDTMLVENLANGERHCGYVSADGRARTAIPSDRGDLLRVSFFAGPALVLGDSECGVIAGAEPFDVVEAFRYEVEFQNLRWRVGDRLVAINDGLGFRRADPDFRRFTGLGALIMDRCDPAVYARHLNLEPLRYPGAGDATDTLALIVTTAGDMNVPASGGVTLGRAAGYIEFLATDERWGLPPNQVLLDTYMAEAVHTFRRYTSEETGEGVHIDVENFSRAGDIWGDAIPRLDPPLHLWGPPRRQDGTALPGISGAIFPYPVPEGQHGFPFPGQLPDRAREACQEACPEGETCDCSGGETFDTGTFLFNMFGHYVRTNGAELSEDLCNARGDCDYLEQEAPPQRRLQDLGQ